MLGVKVFKRRRAGPLFALSALAAIIGAACSDEPTQPAPWSWHNVATFPAATSHIYSLYEMHPNCVYAGGTVGRVDEEGYAAVFIYNGSTIMEAFRAPYEESAIYGLSYADGVLWAAGSKKDETNQRRPYLVTYDGQAWQEVPVPAAVRGAVLGDAEALSRDRCWFNTTFAIYLYDRGEWQERLVAEGNSMLTDLVVTPGGRLYVREYPYTTFKISDDGGLSWRREAPDLGAAPYTLGNLGAVAGGGENLLLIYDIRSTVPNAYAGEEEFEYEGAVMRDTSPPAEGAYSIAFLAPPGPHLYRLTDIALRSATDGRVVGGLTSIALRDGEWILEEVPAGTPDFDALTAGDIYYWAVINDLEEDAVSLWRAE